MRMLIVTAIMCATMNAQDRVYANEGYGFKASLPKALKIVRAEAPLPDHGFKATFPSETEYLWVNAEYAPADSAGIKSMLRGGFKDAFGEACSTVIKRGEWVVGENADKSKVLAVKVRKSSKGEGILYEVGLMTGKHDESKRTVYFEVLSSVKFEKPKR